MAENDNTATDFVMDLLTEIAVEYDVGVDVPHQIAKGKGEAGNADAGRGASAIKDGGRLVYTQTPMSEAEAKDYGIDPEQMRALRPHRQRQGEPCAARR